MVENEINGFPEKSPFKENDGRLSVDSLVNRQALLCQIPFDSSSMNSNPFDTPASIPSANFGLGVVPEVHALCLV
jgi:hypothetical protein